MKPISSICLNWLGDKKIQACSLEAQGLLINLLSLMQRSQKYGYLLLKGKAPENGDIAKSLKLPTDDYNERIKELFANDVLSVNEENITYYKEMIADENAGEHFYLTKRKRKLTGKRFETFNRFWDIFDYKSGKAEAADAWYDIPALTNKILLEIYNAAHKEAQRRSDILEKGGSPKMAQGWLTARRWEDEIYKKMASHGSPKGLTIDDIKKLEK